MRECAARSSIYNFLLLPPQLGQIDPILRGGLLHPVAVNVAISYAFIYVHGKSHSIMPQKVAKKWIETLA
jgi:hypothetical protein